jgi:octaprenyl-diphosphate synthase
VLNSSLSRPRNLTGMEALSELLSADMSQVNALILSKTGSDVTMIPEVANHLISSGGKRLRPMLALAGAHLCGYEGNGHIALAAAVEFMHTATLLHDDVVDESDMRRGKKAARMVWGNEASVLVGDFLLGQAFRMMVDVGSLPCLDILSTAATVIAEGEVMQLAAAQHLETTEAEYLNVIRSKTAALFAAACEVGPALVNAGGDKQHALRSYGEALGIAFQLVDDALDYGGDSQALGKSVGDDFREGKITLPIILALQKATNDERIFWRRTLGERDIRENDLEQAINILDRHKALTGTLAHARHYGDTARKALTALDDSPLKQAFVDVVEFVVSRGF